MSRDRAFAFPSYSTAEKIVDGVVHGLCVPAALGAGIWLIVMAALECSAAAIASLAIYSVGMIGMFGASALYNLTPRGRWKEVFRRLDHSMIYVMIAGSYTPFAVNALGAGTGTAIAVAVWSGALIGIILKVGFPRRLERVGLALYLILGWLVVVTFGPLMDVLSGWSLALLIGGGVLYTIGSAIHCLNKVPFHNAVWHILVLGGATCHFVAVSYEFLPW